MFGIANANSMVNPSNEIYKDYYYEDSDYFYFSANTSVTHEITANLQSSQIITDLSLLPFTDNLIEETLSVP